MKSPEKLISSFVTSAEFVFFCKNSKLTIAKKCKKMNENLKAMGISDQRERKSKRQFFPTHKTKTSTVFGLILLFSVGNTFKIEIHKNYLCRCVIKHANNFVKKGFNIFVLDRWMQ